uniref:Uncharacterized protein n=1 Tax=Mycena chlorophos TaxID=658473 RepID=A0ABQ0LJM9_MYCCL|nr:predicted protein [Mycena chlorophos]
MSSDPTRSVTYYKPQFYCPDPFPALYPLNLVYYSNDGATGPRITNANPGSLECSYQDPGGLGLISLLDCVYDMVSGNLTDSSGVNTGVSGTPFACDSTAISAPCGVRCPLANTATSLGDSATGHLAMVSPSTTDDTTDCTYYRGSTSQYYFDANVSPDDLDGGGTLDTPAKTTCVSPQRRAEIRQQMEGMKLRRNMGEARRASRTGDGGAHAKR